MSSYVLDRELLLNSMNSARASQPPGASNWIDVNSNNALVGSSSYQLRGGGADQEFRKQLTDLQDQLKMLKVDVEKKDKLIVELSSIREHEKAKSHDASKFEVMYSVERSSIEMTKRELATAISKYEAASNELFEHKAKLQAKEERIGELKRDMETLKSENSTMNSLIVTQRGKIRELEEDLGGFENVASKSGITITTLQKDNKELQQTVLDLEARIRTHMSDREETERKMDSLVAKLNELAAKVSEVTGVQITGNSSGLELLVTKITEIVNETTMMKGKLLTTSDNLSHNEAENRANRETIQRLVNELNKLEKDTVNTKVASDTLKAERDAALNTNTVLEKEIETLKERMSNIQQAWQATKGDFEAKEASYAAQSANAKQLEYDALYAKNCLDSLKEQVATLLSDGFVKVDASEEQIKEKIKLLMTSSKDRGLMIASMESKMQQLATQLNEQIQLYKELEAKFGKSDQHAHDLESRVKSLDNELCANEVLKESLKNDRLKYFAFLERLGHVLKVSEISADVGLEMNIDVLLTRAEQLIKLENDSLQDKQINIYNLHRKVKTLKEQLDNKELHLELLRKKVTSLEEERASKTALEREVDDHVLMSKKFKVKVDKLTEQLNHLRCENSELKAQLLDTQCLKGHCSEQEKEIKRLVERIGDLESLKEKQSLKMAKLRDELDVAAADVNKARGWSESSVQAMSQELKYAKQSLERTQDREKQLLDFRTIVARMLGLDANKVAVADYEIVARIERILAAFNGGIMPVHVKQVNVSTAPAPPPPPPASHLCQSRTFSSSSELYSSSSGETSSPSPSRLAKHSPSHHHHQHQHPHHHHHQQQQQQQQHSHSHEVRERSPSPSPSRHHHHHPHHQHSHPHSHSHSHQEPHHSSSGRSKSPRKVTIDPNSY